MVSADQRQTGYTQATSKGTWSVTLPGKLLEGTHTLTAQASNGQGLVASSVPYQAIIDLTAPVVGLQVPTFTGNTTPTVNVTARSTDNNGMSNTVTIDVDLSHDGRFDAPGALGFATGTLNSSGAAQVLLPKLQPGSYEVRARVADLAGNQGVSQVATLVVGGAGIGQPLNFEVNEGQTDSQVTFMARTSSYNVFLSPGEITLGLQVPQAAGALGGQASAVEVPLQMQFDGANLAAPTIGVDPLATRTNYFIGNDPSQWHVNVPNFGEVHYQNLYNGVDLVARGSSNNLQYEFLVAPGANPRQVILDFGSTATPHVNANGTLTLTLPSGGTVTETAPVLYQTSPTGQEQTVAGSFLPLGGSRVGLYVGSYDTTRPLVIDPSILFSTYLGGSSVDGGNAIVADASGDTFVTGNAMSPNFPTTAGAFQTTSAGAQGAFVSEFNAIGTLVFSSYLGGLGGTDRQDGNGIALDASGIYLTGDTNSLSFPTTLGAFQTIYGGGLTDAFVTKLSLNGSGLLYSTYLGGNAPIAGMASPC